MPFKKIACFFQKKTLAKSHYGKSDHGKNDCSRPKIKKHSKKTHDFGPSLIKREKKFFPPSIEKEKSIGGLGVKETWVINDDVTYCLVEKKNW